MPDTVTPTLQLGPVAVYFGDKGGKYPDGNQVVVRGRDAMAVFDTPQVANRIGAVLADADLAILGHVHEDHMAGLHLLRGKPLHVHHADLAAAQSWAGLSRHYGYPQPVLDSMRHKIEANFHYAPRPDALGYDDGAVWELGGVRVRALHFPGHTAGHCVLLVEPDGIAFIGDIDLSGFGPYYGDASSSLADFRRSLARLRELPARAWITSHHRGVYTERKAFDAALDAYAARIDEREARLLERLTAGALSMAELVRQRLLYPVQADDPWIDCAEQRSIGQHLAELVAAGRVSVDARQCYLARGVKIA
jgi:glyoxylase-like metal-dependent hydrolase (beta-lactamase superfamily II)